VCTLRIANETKRNAMTHQMHEDLAGELRIASKDTDLRVVVLRGAGGDFCSGRDLSDELGLDAIASSAHHLRECALLLRSMPVPTVCVVRGVAYGAGFGLVTACALRLAGDTARLSMPVLRLGGAYPTELLQLLAEGVGLSRAVEIFLTGRVIHGPEAAQLGLVHLSCDDASLDATASKLVGSIAQYAPEATSHFLRQVAALRAGTQPDAEVVDELERLLPDIADSPTARRARASFRARKSEAKVSRVPDR
jgi:enoyl-CoA hydratase/carnithine racemase